MFNTIDTIVTAGLILAFILWLTVLPGVGFLYIVGAFH